VCSSGNLGALGILSNMEACQPLDAVPVTVAKALARAVATTWDTDVATAVELACELPPV